MNARLPTPKILAQLTGALRSLEQVKDCAHSVQDLFSACTDGEWCEVCATGVVEVVARVLALHSDRARVPLTRASDPGDFSAEADVHRACSEKRLRLKPGGRDIGNRPFNNLYLESIDRAPERCSQYPQSFC